MNKYVFKFLFLMFVCTAQAEHAYSVCHSHDSKSAISAYCIEGLSVDSLKSRIANCETMLSKLDTTDISRHGINDTIAKVNAELKICNIQLKQYSLKVEAETKRAKNMNTTLLYVLALTIFILILDLCRIIKKMHNNSNNLQTFQNSQEPDIKEDKKGGAEEIETIKESESEDDHAEIEEGKDIKSVPEPPTIEISDFNSCSVTSRIRRYTEEDDVIGVSLQGDNHVKMNPEVPCQDYHAFTKINDIWNVAIVSDGAGSKKMSHKGSEAVCLAFTAYLKNLFGNDPRFIDGSIVDSKTWDIEFRTILSKFQNDVKKSLVTDENTFDSYSATIIVLAYSSKGYMVGHVGDGRAGVLTNGEWKSIINPHKGEEANQTIFSTTLDFSKNPNIRMSGIYVPETSVSTDVIDAFILMSDGCEQGLWVTYQKEDLPDGDFHIVDKNKPRIGSIEYLFNTISGKKSVEKKNHLIDYLLNDKVMQKEGDDKTILIGRL